MKTSSVKKNTFTLREALQFIVEGQRRTPNKESAASLHHILPTTIHHFRKTSSDKEIAKTMQRVLPEMTLAEIRGILVKAAALEHLKSKQSGLFKAVSAILYHRSPDGISFGNNEDEFDQEAGTIIPRLSDCHSESDVLDVVYDEFDKWFSGYAMKKEKYTSAAVEIWQVWQKHKAGELDNLDRNKKT